MPRVIAPNPSQDDEFFWEGVRDGKLLIASCARCGSLQHPPSPMCPVCAALEWTPAEVSGRGTVLSWVVSPATT
ncbi:MAG: zinc ribbon domain-containing protein, partial [Actinomycetota bacterium]|nr:zinc ribbon domain-containing protein [Actinomycetota bacterium]